jgi:hypothetical protein
MQGEERKGEGSGEERGFGDKTPVYGPSVEEGPGEIKSPGEVAGGALAEGVAVQNLFLLVSKYIFLITKPVLRNERM